MRSLERLIIQAELVQRREEGCDTSEIGDRIEAALENESQVDPAVLKSLYEELDSLVCAAGFPYDEPSTLGEIRALRPEGPRQLDLGLSDDDLRDRIHGAWLGRAAGCCLGKPVEGWPKAWLDSYLEHANALPLDDYIPFTNGHPEGIAVNAKLKRCTRGNIAYMERDDDMDYPILGLLVLEARGRDFTSLHIANNLLSRMPYNLVYTAESAAYRNLVNRRWPPESATYHNPFREWIGAQIRADIFGYVTPGNPALAAEFAFRDARVSHVKNGIYGEMFVAAMLSAAFVTPDVERIIQIGLSEIPTNCRLAEAVSNTVAWCRQESDWERVWDNINEHYGHYHGVHTINNAALVVMGLLFGANCFETGIVVAVRGGWDTDCNGATVGSILGARLGARALPRKWVGVLNDRLLSAVRDCTDVKISDLAGRTFAVAKKILTDGGNGVAGRRNGTNGAANAAVGVWNLEWKWGSSRTKQTLFISPDLSATLVSGSDGTTHALSNVRVDRNTVRFSYVLDKGGWQMELLFEGVIHGDILHGDFFGTVGEMAVTGIRESNHTGIVRGE